MEKSLRDITEQDGGIVDSATVGELKKRLRLVNYIYSFVALTLLALIVGKFYGPARDALEFLPDMSIRTLLIFSVCLTFLGMRLSRAFSDLMVSSMEKYSYSLNTVLKVTRDIKGEVYSDILLDQIAECCIIMTDSDSGSILINDGDELVFKVAKGEKGASLVGKGVPVGTGIAGWVFEHGSALYFNDMKKAELFNSSFDGATGYTTRSLLCIPLRTRHGTVGVIEVLNKRSGEYDDKDVEMVTYLADQAAASFERAWFYEDQRNYEVHMTGILVGAIDRLMSCSGGHSKRVAGVAGLLGKAVKMSEEQLRSLHIAALLHGVGLLRDESAAGEGEDTFRKSYETIKSINFYSHAAAFVRHMGSWFDGSKTEDGVKGADLPLESRILAVADAFDSAMSCESDNSYEHATQKLLEYSGTRLDPGLVDLFLKSVSESEIMDMLGHDQ